MINKIDITREVVEYKIISKTCDRCKKTYDNELEMQEFHHIYFCGGYGSVFGDTSDVEADICQHCLKSLIYDFCRIDGLTNEQYNLTNPEQPKIEFKKLTQEQKEKLFKLKKGFLK